MKILKSILFVAVASLFALIGGPVLGSVLDVNPLIPGVVIFAANFIPGPRNVLNMLLFTAPGGVGTPFVANVPILPQFLHWNDAGNPITNLRISTSEEGVLHDFDAAALAAMNGYMKIGPMGANDVTIRLATGQCKRNVTINGTTAAVGAINFYSHSDNRDGVGDKIAVPFKSQLDTVIALSPQMFQNFTALFIPTMATLTDYADIIFSNGHVERYEIEDLIAQSTYYQEIGAIIINNFQGKIHRVTLRCAANTPVYTLRVSIPGQ